MAVKWKYDLDFRPKTYWISEDLYAQLMSTIKDEKKCKAIQEVLNSGRINELQKWLTSRALTNEERAILKKVHKRYEGEVEIASIVMRSTLTDVISFEAKLTGKGIQYSINADFEVEYLDYNCKPQQSTEPLTMREVISMIDNLGIIEVVRDWHVEEGYDSEEMVDFCLISSRYYPELAAYYEEEALEWCKGKWFDSFLGDMAVAYSAEELIDYCEEWGVDWRFAYEKLSEDYEPLTKDFLYELCRRYPGEFSSLEARMSKPLEGQLELSFGNDVRS